MDKHQRLVAEAGPQGGYFTARDALATGYSYRDQHYHTSRGHWLRVAHGVYRLRDWPLPARPDLIVLALLSRTATGVPQAVVSHESALAVHDLSDANPARIHLTVPPGFRKRLPPGVVLHRARLTAADWEEHEGYRVTTPYRTLLDLATTATGDLYLPAAVRDVLQRGLVTLAQLRAAATAESGRPRLQAALRAAENPVAATRRIA